MFSNYKTRKLGGKALATLEGKIIFSDIYPRSISDSKHAEECGAVYFVKNKHEIMSNRGFLIKELCIVRGISLNRPKQKENNQFAEKDIAANFDITATQIYVDGLKGRVRNWRILNST